MGLSD